MRCIFVGSSTHLPVIASKCGHDLEVLAVSPRDVRGLDCDLALVPIPAQASPEFRQALVTLDRVVADLPGIPVIALVSAVDRKLIRAVLRAGAHDFVRQDSTADEMNIVLRHAVQLRRFDCEPEPPKQLSNNHFLSSLISSDDKMLAVFNLAANIANSDASVLLSGETGTGKGLLARAIHDCSPRAGKPFVSVSCFSLPETLIEAELFGHERGAFTGAVSARPGRFEVAGQGTVFIDEVGDLPLALQVKLLRVLQERTFERLGSNTPRPMAARVICATNRSLKELVAQRSFRADLYYRLNTVEICVPPLRERSGDISVLSHAFIQTYCDRHRRSARRIHPGALTALNAYHWPGNVRELEHVIERAVLLCDGTEILKEHLPPEVRHLRETHEVDSLGSELRNFKRKLISKSLASTGYNKAQTARLLRISRASLHRLIDQLQIASQGRRKEQASADDSDSTLENAIDKNVA